MNWIDQQSLTTSIHFFATKHFSQSILEANDTIVPLQLTTSTHVVPNQTQHIPNDPPTTPNFVNKIIETQIPNANATTIHVRPRSTITPIDNMKQKKLVMTNM
jgi:hypothetical protein